ncbi:hypothetical protein B0J15DRAFT_473112 [Fusarium solani]|uniref:HypA-like protein n=1 Tax=Fusarium solani TaxID=169388 RepID=A0A9P9G2N1_FUSSL|nr:uncharacterized protein B0J15DRAFT_473112 [Fusarium solani]KAH7230304.1 hypothetical protein B0J15DRAFT_473112 [Fusarium solani]
MASNGKLQQQQSSTIVSLDIKNHPGAWRGPPISGEAVEVGNRVLQLNHDKYHPFFSYMDREGVHFHNYLTHHALTLLSLGASPKQIQHLFDINTPYQRGSVPVKQEIVENLSNSSIYKKSLGDEDFYTSFLKFFEKEVDSKGAPAVLQKYVFDEDLVADDMLQGFIHPLVQLGLGIEFNQPAIVAEGLAQAAVHSDHYLFAFFHEAEERAPGVASKYLAGLLDLASADEKCRNASNSQVREKVRDGVLLNVREEAINLAAQYQVGEDEVDLRLAEPSNASAYMVAEAQRWNKAPRMDFFVFHALNTSIFLGPISKLAWLSQRSKARLLTYAGRMSLLLFIDMGAAPLDLEIIRQQQVSKPYEDRPEFRLKGKDFEKFAVAIVDSLNPKGGKAGPQEDENWIRGSGFDDVWETVPSESNCPMASTKST